MVSLNEFPQFIGRDRQCQIVLDDVQVSRQHCRIDVVDEKVMLSDLRSRNGTLFNSRRITTPVVLSTGDRIIVGRTVLQLFSEPVGSHPTGTQTTMTDHVQINSDTRIAPRS